MPEYSSGVVIVSSDVTSSGVTVLQQGMLQVLNGGLALETVAVDGGAVVVSGGGTLKVCTVSPGGTVTVLENGYASDVAVAGGLYIVSSGGFATKSEVKSGGTMQVFAEVRVTAVEVKDGGTLEVNEDGYAKAPILSQGGRIYVNGGLLDSAGIADSLIIDSGGMASSSTVLDGGEIRILGEDSFAMKIGISSGGTVHVSGRAELFMASMFEGASVIVSDGGYCTSIKLNGGKLDILPGAFAEDVTVNPGAELLISSGAEATDILENGGYVYLEDGANVTFLPNTINDLLLENASATIHSGTTATETTVNSGGGLDIFSGATATKITENGGHVEIADGAKVSFVPNTIFGLVLSNASATLHSGTTATETTVNSDGRLDIYSGATATKTTVSSNGRLDIFSNGTATGILENGGYVKVADGANVSFVQNTISGLVLSDASATVHAGTVAKSTTVNAGARLDVFSGGKLTGQMMFERGAAVSFEEGGLLDFDLKQTATGTTALVNDLSIIQGTPLYTLSVDADLTAGTYDYALAEGAAEFDTLISVVNEAGEELESLLVGKTIFIEGTSYTLNLNGSVLSVTVVVQGIDPTPPTNLVGTKDRVSWDSTGATGYVVEYSTDQFGHVLRIATSATAIDLLDLPAGTYQWRVAADNGGDWAVGENIVSDNADDTAKVLSSNADANDDLFFAKASGTWENIFYAQHVGSVNDWTGTRETVSADGKGRIQNLFFGSTDPNVLCLTDADNGDAIFVDDIYTELPEGIEEHMARLYRIQEIRAGAGDDIIDMTSQRFEYVGDGLTIRGGDGNDVIWANKGNNFLFGDSGNDRIVGASGNDVIVGGSGNDRMHGGGGNDVFTFCENWGIDTVEQLTTGSVTLWFASGSIENWDEAMMTYTDGENSVTVKGVSDEQVALIFGDDDSDRYNELMSAGAFADFTSQKIFEESGFLASL